MSGVSAARLCEVINISEIKVQFNPGWVKQKDYSNHSEAFSQIIDFYLFGTPCELTSSSGISMKNRKWGKDVWKSSELRFFLLYKANLKIGDTFVKAKRLDEMSNCVSQIALAKNFHTNRETNRVAFYSDGKRADFMSIFYYIRCAFAHGRFQIFDNSNGEKMYVLEAIGKKQSSLNYISKARFVLKEQTLISWANTVKGGKSLFMKMIEDLRDEAQNEILRTITNKTCKNKSQIFEAINLDEVFIHKQFNAMVKAKIIRYDNSNKIWKCV